MDAVNDRALKLSAGLRLLLRAWDSGALDEERLCVWLDSFYPGGES